MNLGLDFLPAVGRLKGLVTISLRLSLLSYLQRRSLYSLFPRALQVNIELAGDARLFDRDQTVRASSAGRTLAAARVPADGSRGRLTVPVPDAHGRRCTVRFDVTPTAVPGRRDPRRLGTHFLSLRFSR